MQCVHARVLAEARDLGFGVIVINEDVGSPFAAAMRPVARDGQPTQKSAKPRAATSFLQKALGEHTRRRRSSVCALWCALCREHRLPR